MATREVSLVPAGMVVERTDVDGERIVIWVRSRAERGVCPSCGTPSRRMHSR